MNVFVDLSAGHAGYLYSEENAVSSILLNYNAGSLFLKHEDSPEELITYCRTVSSDGFFSGAVGR